MIPPIPRPKDERFDNMPMFLDDKQSVGYLTTTDLKSQQEIFD